MARAMARAVLLAAWLPHAGVAQRRIEGHVVHSDSLPVISVRVSEQLAYLGRLSWPVDTVAEAEEFVFGDTARGELRRAVIVHFEHFRPESGRAFRYPRLRMISLGGREYLHQTWALAQFQLFGEPAMAEFLKARGLRAEPRWVMDRYVRAVDEDPSHEIIMFYLEAGSVSDPSITYGGAPVAPPPPPTPPPTIEQAIHRRAQAAFSIIGP